MDLKQTAGKHVFQNIDEFSDKPGPFCMSFDFDEKLIISSIKTVGLINKPYIRRNAGGSIDIITGYRRIKALKTLGWHTIPCIDLSDSGLSDNELLSLSFYDNVCTRTFNNVEKCMIINHLLRYYSILEIYEQFMSLLNIVSRKEVDLLIKIEKFSEDLKGHISKGHISIKTLEFLSDFNRSDLNAILKFIINLHLNFNQQMLFIEYVKDISIKEETGVHVLLENQVFSELLNESSHNAPQTAKKLIEILRIRRFPILSQLEKTFNRLISGINLPKNAKIKHSPFFEGSDYILEISFKDGKKLKNILHQFLETANIETITDPWVDVKK